MQLTNPIQNLWLFWQFYLFIIDKNKQRKGCKAEKRKPSSLSFPVNASIRHHQQHLAPRSRFSLALGQLSLFILFYFFFFFAFSSSLFRSGQANPIVTCFSVFIGLLSWALVYGRNILEVLSFYRLYFFISDWLCCWCVREGSFRLCWSCLH